MTGNLVAGLLSVIEQLEREALRNAYHPDHWSVDQLHDYQEHPAYEYAETWGDFDDEPPRPDGEGWELNATPARAGDEWSDIPPSTGRRTHVGIESGGPYSSLAYWRRLRPEREREWTPDEKTAAVLRLCRAHRKLVDEWRKQQTIRDVLADDPDATDDAYLTAVGITAGLWAAVTLVAEGLGLTEEDSSGE